MPKKFVIWSGTSIQPRSEEVTSATEAVRRVLEFLRVRRPNIRIETADGDPLSYFQLRELAALEGRKNA
jgi:hypothetical protein